MRTLLKFNIFIFSCLLLFSACEEEVLIPKTGEPFGRGNTIKFYFCDGAGNDLLNLRNNTILPVTFEDTINLPEPPTENDTLHYYYNGGVIKYDLETEKYYWRAVIYGKEGYTRHQFYVYISESDIDTIKAEFRYTTGAYDGGDGIYANIDKLSYNDVVIRRGENTTSEFVPENIHITKENGNTTISIDQ